MYGRIGNAGRMQYQVGDYWKYIESLGVQQLSQAYRLYGRIVRPRYIVQGLNRLTRLTRLTNGPKNIPLCR